MNNLQRRLDARVKQLRLTRQHLKRTQEALDKSINSEEVTSKLYLFAKTSSYVCYFFFRNPWES